MELYAVEIKFKPEDYKNYSYRTDLPNLQPGDKVVVDAPSTGYTVVTVVNINTNYFNLPHLKWIVCKVEDEKYKKRVNNDKILVEIGTKFEEINRLQNEIKVLRAQLEN